jgi:predicted transcriptional regulator
MDRLNELIKRLKEVKKKIKQLREIQTALVKEIVEIRKTGV